MKVEFKHNPYLLVLWIYILSIEVFSYRAGFVLITYGLFALLILCSLRLGKLRVRTNMLFGYMLTLTIVFGFSIFVSVNASQTMRRWVTMFLMLVTSITIEWGFWETSADDLFDFFADTICQTCVVAFFFDFLTIGPSTYLGYILNGARLINVASQTNVMGMYGAVALNIMLYKTLFRRDKKIVPVYIFPVLMILASQSKKAILCVLLGLFLMLIMKYRHKKIVGVLVLCFAGVAVIYISQLPVFSAIIRRFTNALGTMTGSNLDSRDWSTYYRMQMIEEGLSLFNQHPLIGFGTDTYQFVSSFGTYSHNNYIELLANNGIIGFLAYYWVYLIIIAMLLKRVIKYNDDKATVLLAIIVEQLLMDYGSVNYYNKIVYIYISWILLYLDHRKREKTLGEIDDQGFYNYGT